MCRQPSLHALTAPSLPHVCRGRFWYLLPVTLVVVGRVQTAMDRSQLGYVGWWWRFSSSWPHLSLWFTIVVTLYFGFRRRSVAPMQIPAYDVFISFRDNVIVKLGSCGQTPVTVFSPLFLTLKWSKKTCFSSLPNLFCSVFLLGSWHMQHHPNQRVRHHSAMKVHLKSLKRKRKSSDLSSLLWVASTSPVLLLFQVASQKVHWELHSVPSEVNIS